MAAASPPRKGVARSFAEMATILEDPNLTLNTSTRAALEKAAHTIRTSAPGNAGSPTPSGPTGSKAARWLAEDIGVVASAKV
jgi:hypothetical protein